ncbi:hypothetical protein, partial [Aerococcus loyolae]|uniref:hypothetical protein n=1 Tax=Aerococcus loyolae TaxID=2976809 RepID=UPI001C65A6C3
DSRSPDERIADYTLWLERLTGVLAVVAVVQVYFLIRSDKTARISADAAKVVADAALAALDRPWLVIEDVKCNWNEWTSCEGELVGQFRIGNYGKGPALITSIKAVFFQSPSNGFPINPLPEGIRDFPDVVGLREFINKYSRNPFTETETSKAKKTETTRIAER